MTPTYPKFENGFGGGFPDTKVLFFNTTTFEDNKSNQVRLSDIEILGAIGDSDTAGFAARSTGIHTYFTGELGDAEDVNK